MAVLGAQRWTDAEEALIRETMPRTSAEVAEVARKLGRTRQAVQNRVRRFRGRVRRRWTPAEDRELLALRVTPHTDRYRGQSAFAEIARRLGVSVQAARDRYNELMRKVGHHGQWTREGLWTPKEDATIRRALDSHERQVPWGTWNDVALILGRTPGAVRTRAYNLRRGFDGTGEPG